jgi:O-acetyl-ADP-ribose deacetylase (regulator of RNase III)
MLQAFPCISTGIYGYESQNAAPVAIRTVKKFLLKNPDKVTDLKRRMFDRGLINVQFWAAPKL